MVEDGVRGRWIEGGAGGRRLYEPIAAVDRVDRLLGDELEGCIGRYAIRVAVFLPDLRLDLYQLFWFGI